MAEFSREVALLRRELLYAGMQLERTLTYHFRGSASLLLHRGVHARGTSHFTSELGLGAGLATLLRAPALRLCERVRAAALDDKGRHWQADLLGRLEEIASPILYASHDEDFAMLSRLVLVRVPRWALWYPTSTTSLLHEFGHALAVAGGLDHYLTALGEAARRSPSGREASFRSVDIAGLRDGMQRVGLPLDLVERETIDRGGAGYADWAVEEVFCEILRCLFAYGAGAPEEADRRWLWDSLDYFTPAAARRQVEQSLGFLLNPISPIHFPFL